MAKVRAYGADATLRGCKEVTYGTKPASGYRSLDFKSTDLSSEQPLGDDPLLGRGRNTLDPYRGLISDEGQIEVPFDQRGIGFWLTALFGAPTSTGEGPYTHVWRSGGDDIPSYTFEIGHPKLVTPVFFRHVGTVAESLNFDMGLEGPANGRIQLVAQGEEVATTTIDANPSTYTLRRFSQGRGSIKRDGTQLAGVTGGSLTFSNNLERVRVIREDGKIEAADPTFASGQGVMTVRFDGATLVDEAMDGDPVALEYGYSFADGPSLTFELPRVFLPKSKYAIPGPGGVEASFDWRGAYDETAGTLLKVTLVNDVASY
jgi:hypothetical protein